MTRLADIPIKVVDCRTAEPRAAAKAVLREIHAMLETLLDTGEAGVLDLRALPALGEESYQLLRDKLGVGEVSARIQSFGRSEIQETAVSGVWWVTHYNQDGDIYTELIEIGFFPEILKSHKDDVQSGRSGLVKLLNELA